MKELTKYNTACKCGCGYDPTPNLIKIMINYAEEIAGIDFDITSWSRCITHNASIKNSSPTSSHLKGIAVDIRTADNEERFRVLKGLLRAGFERILIYNNFIHADMDETKTMKIAVIM